jgi:hypothetical protein
MKESPARARCLLVCFSSVKNNNLIAHPAGRLFLFGERQSLFRMRPALRRKRLRPETVPKGVVGSFFEKKNILNRGNENVIG